MRGAYLATGLLLLLLLPAGFAQVKPRIFGAEADKLASGESTTLEARIRNDGTQGSVDWWVECNNIELARGQESLASGETKELSEKLTASCDESTLYECSLYASGQGLGYDVHTDFEFRCRPPAVCEAGELKCEGSQLYECDRRGSEWLLSKKCGEGEKCGKLASGLLGCSASAGNSASMSSMFDGYTVLIVLLVAVIIVLGVLVYTKKKKLKLFK